MSFAKATLPTDLFDVPYAVAGAGPRVLICVNGLQQTMAVWRSLVRRTVAAGFRTVLFDFPHQGRAVGRNGGESLTLQQQVDVLAAVVDHVVPFERVALIGGSWGSLVAAAYAASRPDRVSRLVLGSFQTRPSRALRDVAHRGRRLIETGCLNDLALLFISEFGDGIPPVRREQICRQFRGLRPEQARQMYDQGLLLARGDDFESQFDLARIDAPTLLVNGDLDPLIDRDNTAHVLGRVRSARLHVEPSAGHFLHFERSEIIDTYLRFLTGHDAH
jgi:pimeloyl-ACP methyl ester carboxylesterase